MYMKQNGITIKIYMYKAKYLFAELTATDKLLIVLSTLVDVAAAGEGSSTTAGSSAVTTENSASSLIMTLPGELRGGMSS